MGLITGLEMRGALLPLKLPARRKLRHGIVALRAVESSAIAFAMAELFISHVSLIRKIWQ